MPHPDGGRDTVSYTVLLVLLRAAASDREQLFCNRSPCSVCLAAAWGVLSTCFTISPFLITSICFETAKEHLVAAWKSLRYKYRVGEEYV